MEETDDDIYGIPAGLSPSRSPSQEQGFEGDTTENKDADDDEEQAMDEEDGSDSDLEIITDRVPLSLDNRAAHKRPSTGITPQPLQASTTSSSLTTEYTPRERVASLTQPTTSQTQDPKQADGVQPCSTQYQPPDVNINIEPPVSTLKEPDLDTSLLPPVTAPSSAPAIDISAVGVLDGRPIFEHDMDALVDKPWRRPGSNVSDWFNYGFDEISWEAYCYRRRQLGEDATVLRANVINFSGLPEEQVTNLPSEVRAMVMAGTNTLMNSQQNANLMGGPAMGINAMMAADMSGIQMPMGMVGMHGMAPMHGIGGDMMPNQYPKVTTIPQRQNGDSGENIQSVAVTSQQEPISQIVAQSPHMSGPEFPVQAEPTAVYGGLDTTSNFPTTTTTTTTTPQTSNAPVPGRGNNFAGGFRGSRAVHQAPSRGRGSYRGRARGGLYGAEGVPPQAPVRPASPLPPGVPTGPRNQNRYKDRDGNAPGSEGLDYGASNKDPHGYYGEGDDRTNRSRKRRASPGYDEYTGRGSKRR